MKREDGNLLEELSPPPSKVLAVGKDEAQKRPRQFEKVRVPRTGRWTPEEHLLFINGTMIVAVVVVVVIITSLYSVGLQNFGRNWSTIQKLLPTRTASQIRTHAQKFFVRLAGEQGKSDILSYVRSKPASHFVDQDRPYARLSAGKVSDSEGDSDNAAPSSNKGINQEEKSSLSDNANTRKRSDKAAADLEEDKEAAAGTTKSPHPVLQASPNSSIVADHLTPCATSFHTKPGNVIAANSEENLNGASLTAPSVALADKANLLKQAYTQLSVIHKTILSKWLLAQAQAYGSTQREELLSRLSMYAYRLSKVGADLLNILVLMGEYT